MLLGAASGNLALLMAGMLERGAGATISGSPPGTTDRKIFGIYPLGKAHFVAIPTGEFGPPSVH